MKPSNLESFVFVSSSQAYRLTFLVSILMLLSCCSDRELAPDQSLYFDSAAFLMNDQQTPPEDKGNIWQQVALPDLWDIKRPGVGGTGWYRFDLKLNVPPNRLWGIYLPRINRNAAVFLNGVLLGSDAPVERKQSTSWNHPLYFTIPNGLLKAGDNQLFIRLSSAANCRGRLLPFYMGADELLRPKYEQNYFFRITLSQLVGAFALTMGLCIGLMWLIRREAVYGWFALGSLFWAIYTSWFFVRSMPFTLPHWAALTFSSSFWMIACMWIFVGAYAGLEFTCTRRITIAYCMLSTIAVFALPQRYLFDGLVVAYLPLTILGGWMLFLLARRRVKHPTFDTFILFTSITPIAGLGTHDWFNLAFHQQRPYLMHYSAPFIFLLIGWALVRRFKQAVQEADTLNRELEERVAKRESDLKQAFETIHTLEKDRALKDERERIMRDIHDGVGGQLVSALAMMENSEGANKSVADTLLFALDDLRLIIDSLAPEEEGLPELLTMFKYRYEPKLKEHGITLKWNQSELPVLAEFTPEHSLQLLRIIQEAFTNILKHADASRIVVDISQSSVEGERLASITICDDGKGFPAELAKGGRGLNNMQRRARDIGVKVECFNQQKGACVRICLSAR